MTPHLDVTLDVPLPRALATGGGTAVFVAGWCTAPAGRIVELHFALDGRPQPVMAHGQPRLDPYQDTGDPASYASGFWGMVRFPPPDEPARDAELELVARLADGSTARASLGRIHVQRELVPAEPETAGGAGAPDSAPPRAGEPLIAVCLATFNPPRDLLVQQLDSIRAQTHRNWLCYVSDDCSDAEHREILREAIGEDRRFVVSWSPRRLGFFHNFERAMSMVPREAAWVALADQDDRWYPEKLATLLAEIGERQLVYSDARIVDPDGTVRAETYWATRRNNHSDLLSLLVANSVTGAASLMRRDLLDLALPFPPGQFAHYHDHWLALVAASVGEIGFVDRPLYDYVQHSRASLGHERANLMPSLMDRVRGLHRGPRERIRKWRMHYFVDIARLLQVTTVLELRCGPRMAPDKRRVLARWRRGERSPALLGRLIVRGVRELVGRPETLGAEWMILVGFVWRLMLDATARELPQGRLRLDAVPPPDLAPGVARVGAAPGLPPGARALAEKVAPLAVRVDPAAEPHVNLLLPTIDLDHLFGGYIAKFNLALALARRGRRVRIVTVDPTPPLPRGWPDRLGAYSGLAGIAQEVEIVFGREQGLTVSPADTFVATTWWTAHIAHAASAAVGGRPFLYLIQEYEPFTFPMGSLAAFAAASYAFEHLALFSTALLRDYFRLHRIGVFAPGRSGAEDRSDVFENAITPVVAPTVAELAARTGRRLLFYARPEPHAARNLFELGVLALARAVEEGHLRGWELAGIGSIGSASELDLGDGAVLRLLPRVAQSAYGEQLRGHDLGLALMYTPHPSLVPLEMASAGMLTVTNSFENKTAETLRAISSNLVVAEPTVAGVASAIAGAAASVADHERRVAGSALRWPRSWSESFDARVLAFVEAALGLGQERL